MNIYLLTIHSPVDQHNRLNVSDDQSSFASHRPATIYMTGHGISADNFSVPPLWHGSTHHCMAWLQHTWPADRWRPVSWRLMKTTVSSRFCQLKNICLQPDLQ